MAAKKKSAAKKKTARKKTVSKSTATRSRTAPAKTKAKPAAKAKPAPKAKPKPAAKAQAKPAARPMPAAKAKPAPPAKPPATAPKAAASKRSAPAPSSAAAAGKLRAGDKAPDFALKDQTGRTLKLSDYRGRKLLVYFYPKADTPGCTVQSCAVRDARADFAVKGVEVVGISPDKPTAQWRFDEKYALGFPLLADRDHSVSEAYGAWGEKSNYGKSYMGIIRSSFLIDENGKVIGAWRGVKPEETVPNARALVSGK
jgi:peroxiredoxin Q/BCP